MARRPRLGPPDASRHPHHRHAADLPVEHRPVERSLGFGVPGDDFPVHYGSRPVGRHAALPLPRNGGSGAVQVEVVQYPQLGVAKEEIAQHAELGAVMDLLVELVEDEGSL